MNLKFWKKGEEPFLVLDVGTEAVKTLIAKKADNKLSILGSSVDYFKESGIFNESFNQEELETEITKRAILKSIENSFSELVLFTKEKKSPKLSVLVCLPPNALKAEIVNCKIKRENKNLKISKKEKRKICTDALKGSDKKIIEKASQSTGLMPKEIQILSSKFLAKEIDGYNVSKIEGYQGENLSFKVMIVYAINPYLKRFKKIFKDLDINVLKIIHLAETSPIYFKSVNDGVFCDIGGKISQIIFLKKGIVEKIKYINIGGKDFTEAILNSLNISEPDARSLKKRFSTGNLDPQTSQKLEEILLIEKKRLENFLQKYKSSHFFAFGGSSYFVSKNPVLPQNFKNINDLTKKVKSSQFIPAILTALIK